MTEPGFTGDAPDADPADQDALLDQRSVALTSEAAPPPVDVPEADALEQQLAARPGEADNTRRPMGYREADEADVLDQETDVPVDDEDQPS